METPNKNSISLFIILIGLGFLYLTKIPIENLQSNIFPPAGEFSAQPAQFNIGQAVQLSWNAPGATRITLSPGNIDVTNRTNYTVSPRSDTLYNLTIESGGARTIKAVFVKNRQRLPRITALWISPWYQPRATVPYIDNAKTVTSLKNDFGPNTIMYNLDWLFYNWIPLNNAYNLDTYVSFCEARIAEAVSSRTYLFFQTNIPFVPNISRVDKIDALNRLRRCFDHPNVLGIHSIDEATGVAASSPALVTPESMQEGYNLFKEIYPAKLVWHNEGPVNDTLNLPGAVSINLARDYSWGDIISIDWYVIPNPNQVSLLSSMIQTTRNLAGERDAWFLHQAAPLGIIRGQDPSLRAPTTAELETLAQLSWDGGLQGIAWWGMVLNNFLPQHSMFDIEREFVPSAQFKATLRGINSQYQAIIPFPTPTPTPTPGPGNVSVSNKELNTNNPIFACWTLRRVSPNPQTFGEQCAQNFTHTDLPVGRYTIIVNQNGTTHNYHSVDPVGEQTVGSGETKHYNVFWTPKPTPPPTSPVQTILPSPTSSNLPGANQPIMFGYYHVDSQYGDFKDEVKDFTNTQIILQESFLRSDLNNLSGLNDAFQETKALGHKMVYVVSSDWDRGLDAARSYWSDIEFIYLADEPNWDKTQTENQINSFKAKVAQKGLAQKQIAINYTPQQILNGTSYQASNLNIVGFEAYMDPTLQNSANLVQALNSQIDQIKQKVGNKKMFIVIQAYDRNGAWKNMNSLISIQTPPYLKAQNDPQVIGLFAFSYARPGGTRDNSILKQSHQEIGAAILGTSSTGNTPPVINPASIVTQGLGSGTFPDVAWHDGKVWVAYQQDRGSNLYLYNSSSNLSGLRIFKTFNLGPEALAFARLYSANNILWLAYRDGGPSFDTKLWRSDTDTVESLGRGEGNDPIALGEDQIAWQTTPPYAIKIRDLTEGTVGNAGNGTPTGLSRISDGQVITVDQDRNAVSSGTRPSFAGPLAVVESPTSGALVVFTEGTGTPITLWSGQEANTPRIATDGQGNYAVVTWKPTIRIATFTGPASTTDADLPVGPPFANPVNPQVPTEGLPGFGQLVALIFTWSLNVLGIVVFVMIFFAGFKWFTAAGNTAKVNEARGQITNAVTGAIILLAAWIILYTINPDLVGGTYVLPGVGTSTSDQAQ